MRESVWNRRLGWGLLIAGFAWAAGLDPWSLSQRDPSLLLGSARMAARQAQAVVIAMAFLQLLVAAISADHRTSAARHVAAGLTAAGAVLYSIGFALAVVWPASVWLIPLGALLNGFGFAGLCALWVGIAARQSDKEAVPLTRDLSPAAIEEGPAGPWHMTTILAVITFGMSLDALMGFFAADPERFLPAFLGGEDGVRMRMLRLARAAAVALPVLALLYAGLRPNLRFERQARWGLNVLLAGAATMPLILTLAASLSLDLKYLLPLPALAVFAGTFVAILMARQQARPLELWGWVLIASSLGGGLLMGLYAFDGPLPSPSFLGEYNQFARRLSRLGHAYAVVLGLLSIFVARRLSPSTLGRAGEPHVRSSSRPAVVLLLAGSVTTLLAILLVAVSLVPPSALAIGPGLVALAILLGVLVQYRAVMIEDPLQ